MSEFMLDSGDGGGPSTYGEFHLTLTLAGDADSLRGRLASATEKLGYRIISDDPLVARRSGAGYGSITSTILEYARTLTFRLKPAGSGATLVTFNYVGYPLNYKGAQTVITREAEAIAAFASVRHGACSACGAEAIDDSRFCRRCGVPVSGEPPQLEILRLINLAHAGTRDLSIAAAGFALAIITFALIVAIKGLGEMVPAAVFAMMWALPSLFLTITGFRHLSRTIERKPVNEITPGEPISQPSQLSTGVLANLPPTSVTENTTELLTIPGPKE